MLNECAGLPFNYCSIAEAGDPGGGAIRFNARTAEDTTIISVSDACSDRRNPPVVRYVGTWDRSTTLTKRGTLIFASRAKGRDGLAIFDIVGSNTDREGWTEVAVKFVEGFGEFANGEPIGVQFFRTGDTAAVREGVGNEMATDMAQAVLEIGHELAATKLDLIETKKELADLRAALNALVSEATAEAA